MRNGIFEESNERSYRLEKGKDLFNEDYSVLFGKTGKSKTPRAIVYFSDSKDVVLFRTEAPDAGKTFKIYQFLEDRGFNIEDALKKDNAYTKRNLLS